MNPMCVLDCQIARHLLQDLQIVRHFVDRMRLVDVRIVKCLLDPIRLLDAKEASHQKFLDSMLEIIIYNTEHIY